MSSNAHVANMPFLFLLPQMSSNAHVANMPGGCPEPDLACMQVVELPHAQGPKRFAYDEEWLAILRSTHSLLSTQRRPVPLPGVHTGSSRSLAHPHHGTTLCQPVLEPAPSAAGLKIMWMQLRSSSCLACRSSVSSHCVHAGAVPAQCKGQVCACPGMGALRSGPAPQDLEYVRGALAARGGPAVPLNFVPTAPGHDGRQRRGSMPQRAERNPQVRSCSIGGTAERAHLKVPDIYVICTLLVNLLCG